MSIDFNKSDEEFLRQLYYSEHYAHPIVSELCERMADLLDEIDSMQDQLDNAAEKA